MNRQFVPYTSDWSQIREDLSCFLVNDVCKLVVQYLPSLDKFMYDDTIEKVVLNLSWIKLNVYIDEKMPDVIRLVRNGVMKQIDIVKQTITLELASYPAKEEKRMDASLSQAIERFASERKSIPSGPYSASDNNELVAFRLCPYEMTLRSWRNGLTNYRIYVCRFDKTLQEVWIKEVRVAYSGEIVQLSWNENEKCGHIVIVDPQMQQIELYQVKDGAESRQLLLCFAYEDGTPRSYFLHLDSIQRMCWFVYTKQKSESLCTVSFLRLKF